MACKDCNKPKSNNMKQPTEFNLPLVNVISGKRRILTKRMWDALPIDTDKQYLSYGETRKGGWQVVRESDAVIPGAVENRVADPSGRVAQIIAVKKIVKPAQPEKVEEAIELQPEVPAAEKIAAEQQANDAEIQEGMIGKQGTAEPEATEPVAKPKRTPPKRKPAKRR